MKVKKWTTPIATLLVVICIVFCAVLFKAYLDGKFSSSETLQEYINGYGVFAPLVLIFLQAMQVIVPILPGFFGCAVGAMLFGCMGGFWCNYIGISLGSIIAFFLGRHYGIGLVQSLFSDGKYDKWSTWAAKSKSYTAFLFLAMLLPLFPDDYLCYFSGVTKMTARKFIWIIILGKPWCILAYSFGFSFITF